MFIAGRAAALHNSSKILVIRHTTKLNYNSTQAIKLAEPPDAKTQKPTGKKIGNEFLNQVQF